MPNNISNVDIYRSAMVFVNRYGDKAKTEAVLTALQNDNLEMNGLSVWCRIVRAIEDIQMTASDSCQRN